MTPKEFVNCPSCGCDSKSANPVRTRADIVECEACGLTFLRTRSSVPELEAQYQTYHSNPGTHLRLPETFEQLRTTGLRRNDIMSDVVSFTGEKRGSILDIGCGYGAFLLNARDHGFSVRGVELCGGMAEFASKWLGIPTFSGQLENSNIESGTMQVVTLLHSLEHLVNQASVLTFIHRILEPNGFICGIVPNYASWTSVTKGDAWEWLDPVMHVVHYTPETLKKTLWTFGFHTLKMYTVTGDYDRKLLPTGVSLARLEAEGRGEEIHWVAQKL